MEHGDKGMVPATMDPAVVAAIAAAAERRIPGGWVEMPSGAGHDANTFAPHLPTGMLFIPSIGGRSHDVAEDTSEADIVLGAQVLAGTVERVLERDTAV